MARASDVSGVVGHQAERIDVRIEVSFSGLDPPEGRAIRSSQRDGRSVVEGQPFVGWLGLLGVLQSLTSDDLDPRGP